MAFSQILHREVRLPSDLGFECSRDAAHVLKAWGPLGKYSCLPSWLHCQQLYE